MGDAATQRLLQGVDQGQAAGDHVGLVSLRRTSVVDQALGQEQELARVEVPLAELDRVLEPGTRQKLVEGLKSLGYRYVTLDLEGFRSGSMNAVLSAEVLTGRK